MLDDKRTINYRLLKLFTMIVFGVLLIGSISSRTTVNAQTMAGLPESAVSVDYEAQEIKVSLTDNTKLYYGRGTVAKEPTTYEELINDFITIKTEDGVEKKIGTIDISFLSAAKDEYIYIKGDINTEALKVLVKKQMKLKASYVGLLNAVTDSNGQWLTTYSKTEDNKGLYVNFTAETGYFIFTVDKNSYTQLENIEWRKGQTGQWKLLKDLDLKKYNALGAQLYFRINSGEEQISNESKVNYAKMSNAPKIVIDGTKHSIKLTNKMEYRVKVATGAFAEWTTPTFADNKSSGVVLIDDLVGSDATSNGDGIKSNFLDMEIEVRIKADAKKLASKTSSIVLSQAGSPIFGSSGLDISLVNSSDISKGIKVTNNSSNVYQVAVLSKKVAESTYGAYEAISKIKLTAKNNKEEGYVNFLKVAAGKTLTIPYNKFKEFEKDYVVVCRLASIADNKKTVANEFRLASSIVPVGGDMPTADAVSGAIMMEKTQDSMSKTITFKVENPDSQIYVSIDSDQYNLSSDGKVTITANKGSTKTIRAYSKNKVTGEVSKTLTIMLSFVSDGEMSDYINEWGYTLCKKEDTANNSNSRAIAYQRVYLAYLGFNTNSITLSDLKLSKEEVFNIVQRVRVDNPELLQATGSISYATDGESYIAHITLSMIAKAVAEPLLVESKEALVEIKAQIKAVYGDTPTKVQKVKVVHDYLVLKKQYKTSAMDQNIAGALSDSYTPVCMAYAMAFKYICDELGIQTLVVLGYSGSVTNNHAWNIVNLGDTITYASGASIDSSKWYEMDVTWDDPVGGALDNISYNYFNITTTKMESEKHTRRFDNFSSYPVANCTGTTYSYESVKPQSNSYSNVDNTVIDSDAMKELMERCGEEKPLCIEETK